MGAILDALKKTGRVAVNKTAKATKPVLGELNKRVGIHALYGYATNNGTLAEKLYQGATTPFQKEQPRVPTEDDSPIRHEPETPSSDGGGVSSSHGSSPPDDRVYFKLVDIDENIARLRGETTKEIQHTQTVIKDGTRETIQNNHSTQQTNTITKDTQYHSDKVVEALENAQDDSLAIAQARDIHDIREMLASTAKVERDSKKKPTVFERFAEWASDGEISARGKGRSSKRGRDRSIAGEAARGRFGKLLGGIQGAGTGISERYGMARAMGSQLLARGGSLIGAGAARVAPALFGGGLAAEGVAGGAAATGMGGLLSAGAAALLFGGTGLYSAYQAAKGEDAGNWINSLAQAGYQKLTGSEGTMGSDLYDALHDENNENILVKPFREFVDNPTQKIQDIARERFHTYREKLHTIEQMVGGPDGEKAVAFRKALANNIAFVGNPTLEVAKNIIRPIPTDATQMPDISVQAEKDKATQERVAEKTLNPTPIAIPQPTPMANHSIAGGGNPGGDIPAIITRAVDSAIRRAAEGFISKTL